MMLRVQVSAIFNLDILVCILDKSPELALHNVLWDLAIRISKLFEPVLFEVIALFLECAQIVFAAVLKPKFVTCDQTFGTVPVPFGDVVKWRVKTEGMVAKVAAITNQHLVQTTTLMAKFANCFCQEGLV